MDNVSSVLKILEILGLDNDENFKNEIKQNIKEKVVEMVINNISYEIEQWCNYNFNRPDNNFFEECIEEAETKCRKQIVSKYKELLLNSHINIEVEITQSNDEYMLINNKFNIDKLLTNKE